MGFSLKKLGREIGRPFSSGGFFSKVGDDLIGRNSSIGKAYRGFSNIGAQAGDQMGIKTQATDAREAAEAAAIAAARRAAHDAEVAQLSEGALGAVNLRRRRGSYATRLTGTPTMGASPVSTGKTMLSQ